jgi:O-antigen ligase
MIESPIVISSLDPLASFLLILVLAVSLLGLSAIAICKIERLIYFSFLTILLSQIHIPELETPLGLLRWYWLLIYTLVGLHYLTMCWSSSFPSCFSIPSVAFIFLALFSTLYSSDKFLTLARATTLVFLFVSLWVIWNYAYSLQRLKIVVDQLLNSAFPVYAVGLLLIFISDEAFDNERFRGIMGNPNGIGLVTAILFPLAIWRLSTRRQKSDFVLVSMMAVSVLLSLSRNGIIGVFIGSAYFLWHQFRQQRVLFVICFLALAILAYFNVEFFLSLRDFSDSSGNAAALDDPDFSGRVFYWIAAVDAIKESPLLGYGFGVEGQTIFSLDRAASSFEEYSRSYINNSYLGLTLQLGLAGTAIFFIPIVCFAFQKAAGNIWRRIPIPELCSLNIAFTAVAITGLFTAVFESWPYSVGSAATLPFFISILLSSRLTRFARV